MGKASFTTVGATSLDLQERVQDALRDRENIRWVGRPAAGAIGTVHRVAGLMGAALLGMLCFHFFIGPHALLAHPQASDRTGNWIALVIMSLVALVLLREPWRQLRRMRGTVYLLTDQRVATLHPEKMRRDESFPLKAIEKVEVKKSSRRLGRVIITPRVPGAPIAQSGGRRLSLGPTCLKYVVGAEEVAHRIRQAMAEKAA